MLNVSLQNQQDPSLGPRLLLFPTGSLQRNFSISHHHLAFLPCAISSTHLGFKNAALRSSASAGSHSCNSPFSVVPAVYLLWPCCRWWLDSCKSPAVTIAHSLVSAFSSRMLHTLVHAQTTQHPCANDLCWDFLTPWIWVSLPSC